MSLGGCTSAPSLYAPLCAPLGLGAHPFHEQLRVRVLLPAHRDRLAVVVDLPPVLALRPAGVDPGVEENLIRN